MSDPCKAREPKVIDNDLIRQCIDYQYPKGEIGRLMREEGIPMEDIKEIKFEFMNILKIDHLWVLKSLVKLQLNNNYIEKIERLETLVHLKQLDLSFNKISKIENLEQLVNLEKLSFYDNLIETLENMDALKNLNIFSLGRNRISDISNVNYLRRFPKLASLNMADNPCTENADFRSYVAAFLPQLIYYEYKGIDEDERNEALELFEKPLENLEKIEGKEYAKIALIEQEKADAELHSLSFVEYLNTRHLFDDLFSGDVEGNAFLEMGEDIEELYEEFEKQFLDGCKQVFEIGQKHYKIRKDEIDEFFKAVDASKAENQQKGIEYMETFLEKKTEMFNKIQIMQNDLYDSRVEEVDYQSEIKNLTDKFEGLTHQTWKDLMKLELILFEQMEDVNQNFEQVISDMINIFLEETQAVFSVIRAAEMTYNDNLSDLANRYFTNANLNEGKNVPQSLKAIMSDRESLINAIGTTHDLHLQLIDNREDLLTNRSKEWLDDFLNNLFEDEVKRNRDKLLEINHFLDIQREEFTELISDDRSQEDIDFFESLL